jgi:twitching motility protein PilT
LQGIIATISLNIYKGKNMSLFNKDQPAPQTNTTARPGTMSSAALLKSESIPQKPHSDDVDANLTVNEANFSDLYITPDKKCYVWSQKSSNGLKLANYVDLGEFINAVVDGYNGSLSSYSLNFKNRSYRVERTVALEGEQFCARKMPIHIPDLEKLNLPAGVYRQLISLANKTGLILLTGATGSGKSTTISALIKKYLSTEGGYAFTIEDPIEMPLDGVYQTRNGDLGLCKQTMPPNGKWADGIKSALRSKPRYIYVGEIRSPEAAVELLRAATSGHLVFSTIHGNNVTDAINALAKYAASYGISEDMAYEMIANGFLCCVHQTLSGTPRRLQVESIFSNPNLSGGCAVRAMIRTGRLNFGSIIEQQQSKMNLGRPLFDE